ncbi:MAG: glycine cleavage system protein H [Burkholderiales bacterium]|jgi:glycine cleavage system H protein|nr:glycine cleavage system protein H [Burkholderiales bacterium]
MNELLTRLDRTVLYAPEQDMWVRLEDGGLATVGATHLVAQHGQFMLFSPRPVGMKIARDRSLGVMETAKTALAVHAPLSCEIVEVNPAVLADVTLIEREPYGAGWMFRLRPTLLAEERASLLDADAYATWLAPRLAEKLAPPVDRSADFDIDPTRGW